MSQESITKRKLGYADYAAIPDDGRRHEIIDGEHFVNPAPNLYHQAVSKRLQYQLYTKFELAGLGTMYNAPCDVQLSNNDIVQPDLIVVLAARTRIFTPTKVKGSPDLVVEILSPSWVDHDRIRKCALYQRSGVPEYWIVDPTEQTIDQLVLVDGVYKSTVVSDVIQPAIVNDVVIHLREVW